MKTNDIDVKKLAQDHVSSMTTDQKKSLRIRTGIKAGAEAVA